MYLFIIIIYIINIEHSPYNIALGSKQTHKVI